jgi:hypothetical protein
MDEYDNLNDDQQKVVNSIIKNRSLSFKIGVKFDEMIYEDISNNLLEINHDYTYVNTDRLDVEVEISFKRRNYNGKVRRKWILKGSDW